MLADVIEPETTCQAHDDPWTQRQLVAGRHSIAWAAFWAVVAIAGAVTITVALPGAGNLAAAVVIGLWAVFNVLWLVAVCRDYRFLRSPALRQPWRPVPAGTVKQRNRLFWIVAHTESGVLVLREPDVESARIVRARNRIWLCGTDRGFAVVRCDGKVGARALTILDVPVPGQDELDAHEVPPDSPADDPAVRQLWESAAASRLGVGIGLIAVLLGAGIIALSVSPFQLVGILAGAVVVLGGLVSFLNRHPKDLRQAIALIRTASHWTKLPINLHGHHGISGYSVRHGDRRLRVTVHEVDPTLWANVTATETLWIAGDPVGEAAIGLPGYPAAGLARFSNWPTLDDA